MKITSILVVVAVLISLPGEEARADNSATQDVACATIGGVIAGALLTAATVETGGTAAIAAGGLAQGLSTGIGLGTAITCHMTIDWVRDAFDDTFDPNNIDYELLFDPYPNGPFCAYGDPSCAPAAAPISVDHDPEVDLFLQQTWAAIHDAVLQVSDSSTGELVIKTDVYTFSQQLGSSFDTAGVVLGFAAPAPSTPGGGYWEEP